MLVLVGGGWEGGSAVALGGAWFVDCVQTVVCLDCTSHGNNRHRI